MATWWYCCSAAFAFQHFAHNFFDCLWCFHACLGMFLVHVTSKHEKEIINLTMFLFLWKLSGWHCYFMHCLRSAFMLKRRSGRQLRVFYFLLTVFSPLLKLIILLAFLIRMLSERNSSNYGLLKLVRLSFVLYFIALPYATTRFCCSFFRISSDGIFSGPQTT
jgi:hypothetical protein